MREQPETLDEAVHRQVRAALEEDIGPGDITASLIPADEQGRAEIITREDAVLCGIPWVDEVFRQLGEMEIEWVAADGDRIAADTVLCTLSGPTRTLLTGERTALNFLQTLMGTATTARRYADAVADRNITVLDTRKTIPGLRTAQKYAVRCGGCANHRVGLHDAFLIKENHIAACGSISAAIQAARQIAPDKSVIIEVENLEELRQASAQKPDRIMLDNFEPQLIQQAMDLVASKNELEISGNLTLDDARALPGQCRVYISSGALTKHLHAIDLSMRLSQQETPGRNAIS